MVADFTLKDFVFFRKNCHQLIGEEKERCKMERLTKWNEYTEQAELLDYTHEEWKDLKGVMDFVDAMNISVAINKLAEYEDLEEQGKLLELKQASVNDVVDKLFSHNEIISLWREARENGISVHKRIWYGMAWDIPEELKNCKFVKMFGIIPESIAHADIINIEVVMGEEAEKALEEMEKKDGKIT